MDSTRKSSRRRKPTDHYRPDRPGLKRKAVPVIDVSLSPEAPKSPDFPNAEGKEVQLLKVLPYLEINLDYRLGRDPKDEEKGGRTRRKLETSQGSFNFFNLKSD